MTSVERLEPWERVAVLHNVGDPYGLRRSPGVHSTHREAEICERLQAAGYEIVRVAPMGEER